MKDYPVDELSTAHFVMEQESQAWKVIEHKDRSIQAVRQGGELIAFDSEGEATDYIKARSMRVAVEYLRRL
jgi:hypothetical protein